MTSEPTQNPLLGKLQPSETGYIESRPRVRLYYEVYGNRELRPLVLLNGAGLKIPFLGHLIQRMCRLGYKVLVHEPRGIGRSTCARGPQTTRLLAKDALAVVDGVLGPAGEFFLLSLDLGGMVAQELLYDLVRHRCTPRVRAAFLASTCGGERWRPPPYRRVGNVRRTMLLGMTYTDQADFDRRFAEGAAKVLFSASWMSAPAAPTAGGGPMRGHVQLKSEAPPEREPHPQPPEPKPEPELNPEAEVQRAQLQPIQQAPLPPQESELRQPEEGRPPPQEPVTKTQPPAGSLAPPMSQPSQQFQQQSAPESRGDHIIGLWSQNWPQMCAALPEEREGLCFHLTALKSHFLGPRRAAAIGAAGIKVGVGITTEDEVFPEGRQRLLARRLRAEEHVIGAGHFDCCFFEGVSWIMAGALATFGDSRL